MRKQAIPIRTHAQKLPIFYQFFLYTRKRVFLQGLHCQRMLLSKGKHDVETAFRRGSQEAMLPSVVTASDVTYHKVIQSCLRKCVSCI